jgi:hypothetical protein
VVQVPTFFNRFKYRAIELIRNPKSIFGTVEALPAARPSATLCSGYNTLRDGELRIASIGLKCSSVGPYNGIRVEG